MRFLGCGLGGGGRCTMCGLFGTVDTARRETDETDDTDVFCITRLLRSTRRGANVVVDILKCRSGVL